MDDLLFADSDLRPSLGGHEQKMLAAIDEIDGDQLLGTSPDALADYFEHEFQIEIPVLDETNIQIDRIEVFDLVLSRVQDQTSMRPWTLSSNT